MCIYIIITLYNCILVYIFIHNLILIQFIHSSLMFIIITHIDTLIQLYCLYNSIHVDGFNHDFSEDLALTAGSLQSSQTFLLSVVFTYATGRSHGRKPWSITERWFGACCTLMFCKTMPWLSMTSIYWQLLTYKHILTINSCWGTPSCLIPMASLSLGMDMDQAFRREGHGVAVLLIRCANQRATIVAWLAIWPAIKGAWRCSWVAWLDVTIIANVALLNLIQALVSKIRMVAKIHSSVFSPQGQSWSFGQHLSVPLK